jgi:putative ABC transport system substrate-binding protein
VDLARRLMVLGVVLFASLPAGGAGEEERPAGERAGFRVGVLRVGTDHVPASLDGIREGLRVWGLEDGKNIRLEWRAAEDDAAARAVATQLVADRVDLIVAIENPAVRAAMAATRSIPIVFVHALDPVASGFVKNKVHPELDVTGYAGPEWETPTRQLEAFRELVPTLRRVVVLFDPADPATPPRLEDVRQGATTLKLRLLERPVKSSGDVTGALAPARPGNADGVWVASPNLAPGLGAAILRGAAHRRLPLAGLRKDWVAEGALFFFGPDPRGVGRAVGRYIDRLLTKGSTIWDLGVEFSQSELSVNLRTARALGIRVPPSCSRDRSRSFADRPVCA